MKDESKVTKENEADLVEELEPGEMDMVAGGALFFGDDASDGHEMGCVMAYHHYDWSAENNAWCSQNHFAQSCSNQALLQDGKLKKARSGEKAIPEH